jgi:hypothetical protein
VGDGFLPAGEGVMVLTRIGLPAPPGVIRADLPDLAVMMGYRDARGFVHYRTHDDREYVPKTLIRRRPKYPERTEVFKKLYPKVDADAATRVPHNIVQRST